MKPLLYVMTTFPAVTETFIMREIDELNRRGYVLHVCACAKGRAVGDRTAGLADRLFIHYQPSMFSLVALRSTIAVLLKHPKRYVSSLIFIARKNVHDPWEMLRIMKNFHGAVYCAKVVMDNDIGHIHAHFAYMPASIALIASRLTGAKFSFSAHAWDIYVKPVMLMEKMEAARFIVTCADCNRRFLSVYSSGRFDDKLVRIYHGVDLTEYSRAAGSAGNSDARPPGRLTLLSIGRLIPKKGFRYLVDACEILQKKGYDIACTIIGEGMLKRRLLRAIESKGLERVVTIKGFMEPRDLIRYYREADVFVVASVVAEDGDRDALPNVLIEAMALEVPVIATDVSAIGEALDHMQTGLLVPQREPAMIAEAVETLMHDVELKKRLTAAGRKKVEESFNIRNNIVPLTELFERAAEDAG